MRDPQEQRQASAPPEEEWGDVAQYEEEVPGHTPGTAEGEDEEERRATHPHPDPDKTPGRAEG
jgi:hypothetical protein